jgi:type II secretory pathway component PulC
MNYRSALSALFIAAMLGQSAYPQAKAPAKNQKASEKAKQEEEDDKPPVLSVPPGYKYEVKGRRDPFVNPIPKPAAPAAAPPPIPRPEGLRGQDVGTIKITGVITSREPSMNKVIIVAPGKKNPYFASRGDALFDAVIKEIRSDSVVFTMVSPATRQPVRDIVRTVGSAGENR